jgi:hypothetical protein
METLLDLDSLSIEEAASHLRAIEQRKKPTLAKEIGSRLLLTEEEWMAHMKTKDGSRSDPALGLIMVVRMVVVARIEAARWGRTQEPGGPR